MNSQDGAGTPPRSTSPPKRRWHLKPIRFTRDGILFALGIGIYLHELILQDGVRPEWLVAATTLVGAVPYLRKGDSEKDKREREGGGDGA